MAYFKYFPNTVYNAVDVNEKKYRLVTNILRRIRKKIEITNVSIFEQYFIQDGDRADTLAHQFYGDSTLHWIIMYANYMTNPYYDWPLTYLDLQKYVIKKYGDPNGVHHYEDNDGNIVDRYPQSIGANGFFQDTSGPGYNAVTNFIYEEKLNDKKRMIDIIKSQYTSQIVREFKKLVVE